ncbi:hypothetical protein NE865_15589 [Phthorimaea operculella]|nr:hypothetical protein NE865_15589 [Phthorimaea operculella]
MKKILVLLLSIVAVAYVRYGLNFGLTDSSFISLPITLDEAKAQSWKEETRVDKHLPSLKLYCDPSFLICLLFDDAEYAAGIQVNFPIDGFKNAVWDWNTQGYLKWTPSNGKSYWSNQQYFVNQEYLNTDAAQRKASRNPDKFLQAGSVWVSSPREELVEITPKPEPLLSNNFTKQGCYFGMGLHYWRFDQQTECDDDFFAWFGLYNKQTDLVATGFGVPGVLDSDAQPRKYYEKPTELIVKLIAPLAPQCLYDLTNDPGFVTLHIYYVDTPWLITC